MIWVKLSNDNFRVPTRPERLFLSSMWCRHPSFLGEIRAFGHSVKISQSGAESLVVIDLVTKQMIIHCRLVQVATIREVA